MLPWRRLLPAVLPARQSRCSSCFLDGMPDTLWCSRQFDMCDPELKQPVHDCVGNNPQYRRYATFPAAAQTQGMGS